jgi:ribosome-binding protein aMBF1 (putative translation factor)
MRTLGSESCGIRPKRHNRPPTRRPQTSTTIRSSITRCPWAGAIVGSGLVVTTLTQRVLSQRELARMANPAEGTLWRIENGFSEVHLQTIRDLAGVVGAESKELVEGEE